MNIYDRLISGVYIIAEMSANHAGKLENALKIVRAAKKSGADCLKIQTYTADTLTINCDSELFRIKGGLWDGYGLFDLYSEASTPWDWHKAIKEECEKEGMDFLSTPFDRTAVDFLEELGTAFYKIASFEMVDIPLIEYTASKGKPMVISCGMGSTEEIQDALDACKRQGNNQIVLLRCCSEYPANFSDMNLASIQDMRERFGVPVGLSDHSHGSLAAVVGVTLGACVVEKHFCISRAIQNPDSEFSMEPEEFTKMVADCKSAIEIRGRASYDLTAGEKASTAFRRSLFAVRDIAVGEAFSAENVRSIRPNNGLAPKYYSTLMGKKARKVYRFGDPLTVEELALKKDDTFQSERLIYRGIDEQDADCLVKWRSNTEVIRYFRNSEPITMQKHLAWFRNAYVKDPTRYDFVIIEKETGHRIGTVGVSGVEPEETSCEISYMIAEPTFRHRGFASEAIVGIMTRMREEGITLFYAEIHRDNLASVRTVEKLGYQLSSQRDKFLIFCKNEE